MLPVVAGPRETKRQMLLYTVLCVRRLGAVAAGAGGSVYGVGAGVLSLLFTGPASGCGATASGRRTRARHMFHFSLLYLFLIFTLLLASASRQGPWERGDDRR